MQQLGFKEVANTTYIQTSSQDSKFYREYEKIVEGGKLIAIEVALVTSKETKSISTSIAFVPAVQGL